MIIHYNCTIGSFLLHYLLLIYHPYLPSFQEMIFTLVIVCFLPAVPTLSLSSAAYNVSESDGSMKVCVLLNTPLTYVLDLFITTMH